MVIKNCSKYINIMQNTESNIAVQDEGAVENVEQAKHAQEALAPNYDLEKELAGRTLADCVHKTFNFGESSLTDVDKFKRRLIRSIARYTFVDKMSQNEMWEKLRKDTDCDCFLLMKRMRALTLKKLKRLLAAEDELDNVTKVARLTTTDWLLFDLVLVHENVDLIGKDSKSEKTEEPKVLTELFELVSKYKIEKYQGYKLSLTTAWLLLTIEYNSRGRQCSPMLLQRRWYQMKQMTRLKFYTFWYSYRGNTTRLQQAWDKRPTELETKIAKRFPHLIIQPFHEWEELVASEMVILREDFEKLTVVEPANNKNVDDVEIIETPVETIQVDEDSDVDDIETPQEQGVKPETNATKQSNGGELDVRIVNIKTEPSDNNPNNISPKREESFDEMNRILHCSDIDYDENNELLPKIMNVTGGVELIESDDEADVSVPQHDVSKDSSEMKDSNKNIEINTPNCGVNSEDVSNICPMSDSNKITDFADDRQDFEVQFDDLIIIDDGIAMEDDDIEDECEDMIQVKPEPEQPKENTDEEEDTPKFDFKLLLTPVVYTKKLDDMDVFKFIDFSTVRDKRIIECSNEESKPVDVQEKHTISKSFLSINVEQEVIQDNIAQAELEKNFDIILELEPSTESDLISDHQKIKYSSWLLQKPKNRTYNPIQLCKNPDFNTRLKRLNAGFLMSERNRLMLKECKRLTVDLHKAFENKLIDGTLYLQNSKFTHNCNKTLDSHSFVESKTVKTLSDVDFLKETTKNVHITTNVDLKSAECNHERNLKFEYKIKNRIKVLLETSPEIPNQIHPLQINENESKETELNKDIQLDPLKKDAYGSCATEPNQYQQNSLKHNISGTNCCKEYVDDKIEGKGHIVYKHSTQREPMQDGINSSTEKVVNEKIEAQENNINLETEQIEPNKDICDVDDAQKIEDDIIEPQESEPTNYRKGKKQLSRLQIQRSLSKLFSKVNYRSSTALPSRIPLKWDANSKPTQNNIKISDAYGDALLASSTLDKMFNVLSFQPIDNKLKKHKRKKVLEHLTGQKIPWKKKNVNNKNVENKSSDELKSAEDMDKNDNTGTEANGKVKNINNVTNVKKDKSKYKNGVATKQTKSRYCCWALEKLLSNKQPETPHSCPHPVCICCCRDRLLEKTLQDKKALGSITKKRKVPNTEKVHTKNNLPTNKSEFETNIEIKNQVTAEPMSIILSDDDEIDAKDDSNIDESNKVNDCMNVETPLSNLQEFGPVGHLNESNDAESLSVQSTVPSIQIKITSPNQSTSSTQTSNSSPSQTCTTRVFAGNSYNNNCNTSKTIEIPPLRVTFTSNNETPKPTGQMACFSIQLGNANVTKSNSRKDQFKYNILPHSAETSKPIFLGENKILLYSHDKPDSTMPKQSSLMEGNLSSDPFTQSLLPPGVQIVLLPSGELALSIQPGLNFSTEEIEKLSDILMSVQQQLTTSVKNSSTGNPETIDLINQIEGNNEIPSQTKSTESILETKSSVSDHPKELATINNDDNSQSVVNIIPHDAESNAIDKNPDEIMPETQSLQISNDTDSQINKKSILSDLMEMSGISEKDAATEAKTLNTSKKSPVTPVISLAPEMRLNQTELGTNTQSKICRSPTINASLETRKELSVVSSFDELKKCHEKSCQFYKMDIKTGEIYPINLKIKKKPLASIKERRGKTLTTKVPSACIDLTEDQGEEGEKETEPKVVEKGNVKPVKLIRTIHSTGPNPTRSIILEPRQTSLRSQEPSPLVNILRSKRSLLKPHVDTGNDSSKPTILEGEIENGGSRSPHSDSESDDEPLAKKASRKRDDDATMLYSDVTEPSEISGPIDDIENSLECTEEAMDEELMEPEFLDPDSGGEDEGCILGV